MAVSISFTSTVSLFLALVVGFASGIGAALLKKLTHMVSFFVEEGSFQKYHVYLYFGFPLISLMLVALIKKYIIRKNSAKAFPWRFIL